MKFEVGRIYKFENAWSRWIMKVLGRTGGHLLPDYWDVYLYVGHDNFFSAGDTAPIAEDKIKFCEDWTPTVDQIWSDGDDEYLVVGVDFVDETVF